MLCYLLALPFQPIRRPLHPSTKRCAPTGFRVIEVGAGAGSFTGQAYSTLKDSANSELLQYTCTDISDSCATQISNVVRAPNLGFKVTLNPL